MSQQETVWIVDDDRSIRWVLEKTLEQEGIQCRLFESAEALANMIGKEQPTVIISDIRMPGMDGLTLLSQLQKDHPYIPVIIMTAHSDLESAVASYQGGAFEYLPKPFDVEEAVSLIKRAILHHNKSKPEAIIEEAEPLAQKEIIGEAPAMQEVFRAIGRLANSNITVLINGESGTGKELVAQALHRHSPRAANPFIALNMAAIPHDLIESELFGHEKGAFTGAIARKEGVFEQANDGTLFLDEVTEMPIGMQPNLLRVLETKKVTRVGGNREIPTNCRVISATNRSLIDLAQNNILREDIYFRLAVFPIDIPPLRERKDDIPLLAKVFLEQLNDENGTAFSWTNEQLKELQTYDWPGNVRELRHAIHRAFIMSDPQTSDVALPDNLESPFSRVNNQAQENQVSAGQTIEEVEKELIHATLDKVQGNKTLAAQMLGISTKTLYNRLNAYGGIGEYK